MTSNWSKRFSALLFRYPQIEWKRVMGMRDVLSHHFITLHWKPETRFFAC